MKIGVLSDSHDHLPNVQKAVDLLLAEKVEKIVHCGDLVAPFVARVVGKLKENKNIECVAIFGNNDGERVGIKKIFGEIFSIKGEFYECEWAGIKIAVYHGTDNALLNNIIDSNHYQLVLCGHTHQIRIEECHSVLVVNPGEVCGYLTNRATCAIVDLTQKPLTKNNVKILEIS